ncbi:MAG: sulfotransferase [Anaerolineae bacterium]|nr:sulfotransferase [Anaerolineae bacterium]
MRVNFRRFFHHIHIALFERNQRDVKAPSNQMFILAVFLLVLVPILLPLAWLSWLCDKVLFSRHRQITVRQPVFIIGNMRSGTTLLHRLMAKDTRTFCHLKTWELGFAPTITQRKLYEFIARVDAILGGLLARLVNYLDKQLLGRIALHPTGLFEAEEDDLILLYVWSSTFIMGVFPYPDEVLNFILPFDDLPEERERVMPFYKAALQRHLYHHKAENKHILSKNPVFSSRIDALYETFPDARFIYLIRNPLDVVASMGSYMRAAWSEFQGSGQPFPYDEHIWETVKKWYGYTLERLEQAPPDSHIIISFDELTQNPRQAITRIYEHFGFDLSTEFDQTLIEATKQSRAYNSNHTYSFENTGFTREQVMGEFSHIIERFGFEEDKEETEEHELSLIQSPL